MQPSLRATLWCKVAVKTHENDCIGTPECPCPSVANLRFFSNCYCRFWLSGHCSYLRGLLPGRPVRLFPVRFGRNDAGRPAFSSQASPGARALPQSSARCHSYLTSRVVLCIAGNTQTRPNTHIARHRWLRYISVIASNSVAEGEVFFFFFFIE